MVYVCFFLCSVFVLGSISPEMTSRRTCSRLLITAQHIMEQRAPSQWPHKICCWFAKRSFLRYVELIECDHYVQLVVMCLRVWLLKWKCFTYGSVIKGVAGPNSSYEPQVSSTSPLDAADLWDTDLKMMTYTSQSAPTRVCLWCL